MFILSIYLFMFRWLIFSFELFCLTDSFSLLTATHPLSGDRADHRFNHLQRRRRIIASFFAFPRVSRFVTTFQHLLLDPYLLPHLLNQLRQLHLNRLPRFGVHILGYAFAILCFLLYGLTASFICDIMRLLNSLSPEAVYRSTVMPD